MLNEYRKHLSYNNAILNAGNWHQFFSAMYASISKSEWTLESGEDGETFAILSGIEMEISGKNIEDGASIGLIGMELTENKVFVTDKSVAKNVIF